VPPRSAFAGAGLSLTVGERRPVEALLELLARRGFARVGTVREPGEVAVRGGLVDLFPPGRAEPVRLDFFGDTLESIRSFDPIAQTTTGTLPSVTLAPVSELVLDTERIARFRERYRAANPVGWSADPLYEAVSAGQRWTGMEHWLPYFFPRLETLFDYVPGAVVTLDHQAEAAVAQRFETVADYHEARRSFAAKPRKPEDGFVYRPVEPAELFLEVAEWRRAINGRASFALSPFEPAVGRADDLDAGFRPGADFSAARAKPGANVFDAVRERLAEHAAAGTKGVIAAASAGARARLAQLLAEHGVPDVIEAPTWAEAAALPIAAVAVVELGLERGFAGHGVAVIGEQDILGERLIRRPKKRRRSDAFQAELSTLQPGDLVVHADHGIGRYDGLETLTVAGAAHDCLRLIYDGGDKLFLPVENIELLSRYGSEEAAAPLDKLGGPGWQSRKARAKQRIKDIADKLLALAAQRQLKPGAVLERPAGTYDEFVARFPFAETDDQAKAIEDVLVDLQAGRAMDRLICGDVGFGKTEVALRAAFIAVMAGLQVAVVVPTTLLARQHFRTFRERFAGLPVKIGQLSRLVAAKDAAETRRALEAGALDIVVGTHAVLGKSVVFRRLGLVIVDEEQHFGVGQKERLKELRADVHVLTLTATPIPRTLQMALSGVRDLSLITTPPVDRLAVRTFVLPFDPVVVREAIQRELFRGGQVFYVCPRIEDLAWVAEQVRTLAPEAGFAMAHGQMAPTELEAVMTRFYDGALNLLISTNIIESGLDIPSVNTIIVHRAELFGLAQLYQLRGRVGRGKVRAYAYLTVPPDKALGETALRRLEVMQTLDSLGAGFQLASHDMDIRGAGNLLGEEQSGHIKEVGIELYQQMLEEAIEAAKSGAGGAGKAEDRWSPQIALGTPVLIPDGYVPDLNVRLGLYRRIADLVEPAEIDGFAAELIDRFGPLPAEVRYLLDIVAIKALCVAAGIAKVDAGPKGAVLAFRHDRFAAPDKLVAMIARQPGLMKLRPDHRLVYRRDWHAPDDRVAGIKALMQSLAEMTRAPAAPPAVPAAPRVPAATAASKTVKPPAGRRPQPRP
jgi:transcription-repair coupling factor (superfamily II helicase)